MHKLTLESFIKRSKEIHNDKYDYSLVEYKNMKTSVNIICYIHGQFLQLPSNHLKGNGCPICKGIKTSDRLRKPKEQFIEKSKEIHNSKYDYSLVEYKNDKTKITIICPIHGNFDQKPYHHTNGRGCPSCSNNKKMTTDSFIKRSKEIHNDKYDYSLVEYKNAHTKIKIICKEHIIFEQTPNSHLMGCGCPICNESKGEKSISTYLKNKNINFEFQKKFDDCKHKRKLIFDFYLPKFNICIEYDGEQHFKMIKWFGGNKNFILRQKRDNIKNNYCKENNIYLLRIKYNDDIFNILNKIINENEQDK